MADYLENETVDIPLLPEVWRDRPEIIYEFIKRKSNYERLCMEVAFVLDTQLRENKIEFATIKKRAKQLDSFLEKLERKQYGNPFGEVTDLAGVRVICLYPDDLTGIEKIVYGEFEVIEKVDKRSLSPVDRIGYSALHYIVKLGPKFQGARYDNLKDLLCEIQVRTILQDAWATIDHHLVYKKRSMVPDHLVQQINELALTLEDADHCFQRIRDERLEYIKHLEKTRSRREFLSREINLDSFKAFCERAFPETVPETEIIYYERILKWLDSDRYKTLKDLDDMVKKAAPVLEDVIRELAVLMKSRGIDAEPWTNSAYMQVSLDVADKFFRERSEASPRFVKILEKYDRILNGEQEENIK